MGIDLKLIFDSLLNFVYLGRSNHKKRAPTIAQANSSKRKKLNDSMEATTKTTAVGMSNKRMNS